eukprot:4777-Heterococcus_DN1.PRE.2
MKPLPQPIHGIISRPHCSTQTVYIPVRTDNERSQLKKQQWAAVSDNHSSPCTSPRHSELNSLHVNYRL